MDRQSSAVNVVGVSPRQERRAGRGTSASPQARTTAACRPLPSSTHNHKTFREQHLHRDTEHQSLLWIRLRTHGVCDVAQPDIAPRLDLAAAVEGLDNLPARVAPLPLLRHPPEVHQSLHRLRPLQVVVRPIHHCHDHNTPLSTTVATPLLQEAQGAHCCTAAVCRSVRTPPPRPSPAACTS